MEDTMTSIDPPPGVEDLVYQAQREEIRQEREALEAERMALVRQRRDDVPPEPVDAEPGVPGGATAVIDPDGAEYELDDEGNALRDDDDNLIPKWPHETMEFKGRTFQVRIPSPAALSAFQMAMSDNVPVATQNKMYDKFISAHISLLTRRMLMEEMIDPDGDFQMDDFRDMFKQLATLGTARPTKPSRA